LKFIVCLSFLAIATSAVAALESVSLSNAVKVVDITDGKVFRYISCASDGSGQVEVKIGDNTHVFSTLIPSGISMHNLPPQKTHGKNKNWPSV